jgi:SAM-dependent methyltransferase
MRKEEVKNALRRAADRSLFAVFGQRWISYRASRTWNSRANTEPLVATAAQDATDWDRYWTSGMRDLRLILDVARDSGPLGSEVALEIGCGIGRLAKVAAGEFKRVVATDISTQMLRLASEKSSMANVRYVLLGADQKLPVPDGTVDLVYAWTVFRHVPEVSFEAYLKEASRVLRTGGFIAFEALIRDDGKPFKPSISNPVSEREYTPSELDAIRQRHGFEVGATRRIDSLTPGTSNLVLAWKKNGTSRN